MTSGASLPFGLSSLFRLACLLAIGASTQASLCDAATLRVGPTRPYTTVRSAAQAAQDGDSVLIDAGIYSGDVCSWNARNLVVRGVGGRPHMRANGAYEVGKGTWVINGGNFTAENIEFSGAAVPDANGAGIRSDAPGYLVVRNCYFHDNQNGMLAGADSMLIEYSIFDHNGIGDPGRTHNMYIWGRSVTVRYTYTHRATLGHNLKTRGMNNYILYNRIMDEDGTASYSIDIPDCGRSYVIGNVIEQGPNTDNSAIIAYGAESASNVPDLYVVNNTIVNNRTGGGAFLQIRSGTPTLVRNNIFYGPGTPWSGGTVTQSNNYIEASYNNSPQFAAPASLDFHLTSASPTSIVNAGTSPGTSSTGYPLTPSGEYVVDAQGRPRPVVGAMDIGAFEYGSGAVADMSPPSPILDLFSR